MKYIQITIAKKLYLDRTRRVLLEELRIKDSKRKASKVPLVLKTLLLSLKNIGLVIQPFLGG